MIDHLHQVFPPPEPAAQRPGPWAMVVISLIVFFVSLTLGTRHNDFPYYYHLDEPLEVWMVIQGSTNFHHPLLMGNTTDLVSRILGVEREPQNIVEVGRWSIAVFGALACVVFAWIGFRYAGLTGALASGLLVAMHPLLVELGHYYKEDPALLLGVAVSFLAVTRFWDHPSRTNAILLGLANALAFSGKYIGIVLAVLSLTVLFLANPRIHRGLAFVLYGVAFLALVMLVNYQLVAGAGQLFHGVGREVALLGGGEKGGLFTDKYAGVFRENSSVLILIFVGWYLLQRIVHPKRHTLPEYLMAGFPVVFTIMISLTPKTAERYFLPVSATICLLAGIGMAEFCRNFLFLRDRPPALRLGVFSALLAAACVLFAIPVVDRLEGFGTDAREQLAQWLEENVPADEVIVQDRRVQLVAVSGKSKEQRAFTIPHRVLSNQYAGDFGTVDELQAKKIRYVALMVGQKYKNHPSARIQSRAEFDNFVNDVQTRGTLVWKSKERSPQILNPRLALYRLPVAGVKE